MIVSLTYIVLAILALSFLIFIHELGHYFMARRVGMRVETFSIGFGHPIYSWERKGVKWQIGWLLFGGYVKIAGQDVNNQGTDPYTIPDGFFGKSPLDRIKVALMGPLVNLVFALILFSLLWVDGGREKNFSDYTKIIGWVDPHSELYFKGIRPGDEIISYNNENFEGAKDHLYAAMTAPSEVQVKGFKIDYKTGKKNPFSHSIKPYSNPAFIDKGILTTGITQSARYLIYNRFPNGGENPLLEGAPLKESGIQYGDRVIWVDGELVFSIEQLDRLLNEGRALLTIKRGKETLLRRVARVPVQELKMNYTFKEELIDWQFEAGLNQIKLAKLQMIPYLLTDEAVVEEEVKFIDKESHEFAFPKSLYSPLEEPLEVGDKIIAVDGVSINSSFELLALLQQHRVHLIVERKPEAIQKISWLEADEDFERNVDWKDLNKISQTIGTDHLITHAGDLVLLKPILPKRRYDFALSPEKQASSAAELLEQRREIEAIEDPEKRAHALSLLEHRQKQFLIGLPSQDRKVGYNPIPTDLFSNVFHEIWHTLTALVSGSLNPKWLSGPIGIVQVVHDNWMIGMREALFWIGAISLNLGVLNLLPIPMLDGGTILFSLIEMITRRRLSPKTLEKLILPFALLLIAFFIYLTYNDVSRLFSFLH